jgi:hypothetical protein
VFLSGELREKDAADSSLPVDDIRHASGQPESRRDAIALSDYAIRITQQDEGELVRCGELPMRLHRVRADTDDFRPSLFEEFVAVPKGTGFGLALHLTRRGDTLASLMKCFTKKTRQRRQSCLEAGKQDG